MASGGARARVRQKCIIGSLECGADYSHAVYPSVCLCALLGPMHACDALLYCLRGRAAMKRFLFWTCSTVRPPPKIGPK